MSIEDKFMVDAYQCCVDEIWDLKLKLNLTKVYFPWLCAFRIFMEYDDDKKYTGSCDLVIWRVTDVVYCRASCIKREDLEHE